MIRDFSKEELDSVETDNQMEFTLGGKTLLVLASGLFLLCAACFGLGYATGHHRTTEPESTTEASEPLPHKATTPKGSGTKPGAAAVALPESKADQTGDESNRNSVAESGPTQGAGAATAGSQVRPALAGQGAQGNTLKIQPANAQTQGWMVQIAAISHADDAQVLVDALKKRGYEVTARRDFGDNLIHVQTGPFVNRNDANAMRQKLLNDGYNAIVQ
jgi:cell division septation protein DedD